MLCPALAGRNPQGGGAVGIMEDDHKSSHSTDILRCLKQACEMMCSECPGCRVIKNLQKLIAKEEKK